MRDAVSSLWYFAYGSNMQSATLRGRRSIAFRQALAARAPGWRLVFDKPPLVPIGHSFANVVPDLSAEVLGVAYEIGEEDLAHIDLTEGVLIGNYERVAIAVHPLAGDREPLSAFTLTSDRRDPTLRPSLRYLELLVEGAIEHGLPQDYDTFLRGVSGSPENAEAQAFRGLLDDVMKKRPPAVR
jgi:hypothetical protein